MQIIDFCVFNNVFYKKSKLKKCKSYFYQSISQEYNAKTYKLKFFDMKYAITKF